MQVGIAFGRGGLKIDLPKGYQFEIIRPRFAAALADVQKALAAALQRPIAGPSLGALAAGKRSATVLVCDITRPAPNRVTLPPLLQGLHASGVTPENVTILIATGLHRAATPEELNIIVGPEIVSRYRVESHDAKDRAAHRYLGETRQGTPVWIDERLISADLHMSLGLIEPHLMLGFSGGRKLIAPGVAGQETIKKIHSSRFMRLAGATEGSVEDNPLHHELLEIASMAGHDFLVDVTLNADRQISGIFAGQPVQAHAAGVHFLRESSIVSVQEPFDAVITSAAGFPLDLTFYQSVKGMTAAQHILKPGGPILLVAQCAEGVGSPELMRKLATYQGAAECLREIAAEPTVEVDQWQIEKLALLEQKHPLLFYAPGVHSGQLGSLGAGLYTTADEAIASLCAGLQANARVAVIPDGPYTFARVVSQTREPVGSY